MPQGVRSRVRARLARGLAPHCRERVAPCRVAESVREEQTVRAGGVVLEVNGERLGDYLADARTDSGEQRELRLADRSLLRLNSRTAVDIDFAGAERRLFLRSGEILVETGHGDPRPFVVDTAQGRLRALGTRFLVRREGESTRLIVLHSAVAADPAGAAPERVIEAGQQALLHDGQLDHIGAAPPAADAWSRGMLVADNQRLGDLIATLGEYRSGYLSVDPRVADLRISGSFPLYDSERALAALPPSLPVELQRHTRWWVRVVPRGMSAP